MKLKTVVVGMLHTNCYILADETQGVCAVIDPGANAQRIMDAVDEEGWKVEKILLTHGHFDHIMAAPEIQRRTGADVWVSQKDEWMLEPEEARHPAYVREKYTHPRVGGYLSEGDEVAVGGLTLRVLETPGHSAGSLTLLCGDLMFSGDTLFLCSCGRTDLETGSTEQMRASLRRLALLPGDYRVLPGHEDATTLRFERENNPYLMGAAAQ